MEKEKCTKQYVQTVEKNVKYRSNRAVIDLFIAGNVIKNIGHQEEDIKKTLVFWMNRKS